MPDALIGEVLPDADPAPETEAEETHICAELAIVVEPPLRVEPIGLWVDVRVARDRPDIDVSTR